MGTKLATITKTHRPPIGTTYFFTLNETAKVTFTFKQRLSGRKVKGHCIPQTRRYRHKPSCWRSVTKGTLSFTGHTGQNRLAFQGRITRTKKLPPGPLHPPNHGHPRRQGLPARDAHLHNRLTHPRAQLRVIQNALSAPAPATL